MMHLNMVAARQGERLHRPCSQSVRKRKRSATAHKQDMPAGFLPLKLLVWFLLCIISFFAATPMAMEGFFQFARVLAAVFILLQLVVILETVFRLNEVSFFAAGHMHAIRSSSDPSVNPRAMPCHQMQFVVFVATAR